MHYEFPSIPPGAIIGYRKNGKPIRLIAGGSEPATETPPAPAAEPPAQPAASEPPKPTAPAGTAPAAQPSANGQEPPATADPAATDAGSVEQLPPWAQKLLRDTRNEAATNRAKAKEHADQLAALEAKSQAQLDGIAKALGLKPEEATPEQIMAERDAAQAERDAEKLRARATAVELAVFRAAQAAGANGDALLDSRAFVAKLTGLDPDADGFADQVRDLIKTATEEDARYKAAPPLAAEVPPAAKPEPAVPKSGGEFTGPPQPARQLTEEDAKHMTPAQVVEAMDKGLFTAEGYAPRRASRR